MDFLRRDQPQATRNNAYSQTAQSTAAEPEKHKRAGGDAKTPQWVRVAFVVMFASLAITVIAVASLFYQVGKTKESSLVNNNEIQAVFLTNGQVYFGNIIGLNAQYFNLQNIFYLNSSSASTSTSSTTTAPTSLSLVKLGCELHGPEDQMVINASQVSFWENLKSTGKVSQAITQWEKQNPNGQTCSTTSNSTQQSTAATSSAAASTANQ